MTRPRKQTVDWFPHSCTHGRTIFTLERKYGIQGYGFWFKLLEILGNTEGHFIDAEDLATMKYLQAQTYTDEESCLEILNLLATLDAIDSKLWKQKLIWSDNFVAGLAPCYRNRNILIPVKPDNYRDKPGQPGKISKITVEEGEEGKEGKEGKRKEGAPPPPDGSGGALVPVPVPVLFYSCPHFDIDVDYFQQLLADYPGLDKNQMLMEIKKAADYCTDNPKNHKRNSKGKLVNQKLYLRNWMGRATTQGERGRPMSKAEQVTAANLRAAQEVMKDYE
jgi:hypothetical protein